MRSSAARQTANPKPAPEKITHVAPEHRWDVLKALVKRKLKKTLPPRLRFLLDAKPVRYTRFVHRLEKGVPVNTMLRKMDRANARAARRRARELFEAGCRADGEREARYRTHASHTALRHNHYAQQLRRLGWDEFRRRYPSATDGRE